MAKDKLYFASLRECNEKCLFCVKGGENEPTEYLDTQKCKKEIARAAKEGWKHIFFDGGEPTLRSDLPELMDFARISGFKEATLLTNAVKLSDKSLASEIMEIGRRRGFSMNFSISLHSHKKEISEYLVGKNDTFDKTIEGIGNIIREGGNISIYHLICRYNFKDLPGFVDFLHRKFPETRNICFSFIYPEGAARENRHIFPRLSEVESYLQKALEKTEKLGLTFTIATCGILPLCYLRGYEIHTINQQKTEKPENVKIIDSAKEENFILATREFHEKTKVKSKRCDLCLLNGMCSGIWEFYTGIHGVEELNPVVNKDSFESIQIDIPLTEATKKKIKNRKNIFFAEFDSKKINDKNKKSVLDFIKWMKQSELNYVIRRPLPQLTKKECISLGIPTDCFECRDMFDVSKGRVFFCNGAEGKKFKDYGSKEEMIADFKKSKLKKGIFFKDCPMRSKGFQF